MDVLIKPPTLISYMSREIMPHIQGEHKKIYYSLWDSLGRAGLAQGSPGDKDEERQVADFNCG